MQTSPVIDIIWKLKIKMDYKEKWKQSNLNKYHVKKN